MFLRSAARYVLIIPLPPRQGGVASWNCGQCNVEQKVSALSIVILIVWPSNPQTAAENNRRPQTANRVCGNLTDNAGRLTAACVELQSSPTPAVRTLHPKRDQV
jgi:hypothetical protein